MISYDEESAGTSGVTFSKKIVNAGAVTSDFLITPSGCVSLAVTVDPKTGSAYVQATSSPVADINAATALWTNWDPGAVTVVTQSGFSLMPTAIRLVSTAAAEMHAHAQ